MSGLSIIAPLIIVIALGMAIKSFGFFDDNDRKRLIKVLFWVILPSLLFRTAYLSGKNFWGQKNLLYAAYSSQFLVPFLALLIALIVHKGDRRMQALSAMVSARANNVYLGMPAAILALGEPGVAASSIFLAMTLPIYNLVSILWGEIVLSGSISLKTLSTIIIKSLKNPLVISSFLGLCVAQSAIVLPNPLLVSLKLVGDTATGLALIVLGMGINLSNIKSLLKRTAPDVAIKLVLHPAVMWGLLILWPVEEVFLKTAVIISSMPTAVNTLIIAKGIGLDEQYAGEIVAVTTLLAIVTIPIWISLLGL